MPDDEVNLPSQGGQDTNWGDEQRTPGGHLASDGTSPTLPPELQAEQQSVLLRPGDVVADRFEVTRQLGYGGMGAVYHVNDRITNQERALKVMLPSLLESETARDRFVSEVSISQQLAHEGVVRVFDLGEDKLRGLRFFTMEFVKGVTLNRLIRSRGGKLPLKEALHIARWLCRTLQHAHRYTVHRDLKPQNIMVTLDWSVKVLDFGLAKLMSAGQVAQSTTALGTAYYQAPEQSVHLGETDQRADIYSYGVILYQMLTGEFPVGRFADPSDMNPDVPKALDDVVVKCLMPKPEQRFADAKELGKALASVRAGSSRQKEEHPPAPSAPPPSKGDQDAAVDAGRVGRSSGSPGRVGEAKRNPPSGIASPQPAVPALSTQEAQQLQRNTAPGGDVQRLVDLDNGVSLEFMWIPPGEFMMGSPDSDPEAQAHEKPQHRVTISKGFWMGKCPVTQAQWQAVMGSNPSNFKGPSNPVENVSWHDCQEFLGKVRGKGLRLPTETEPTALNGIYAVTAWGDGFRLPTEAEWEYACRAGSQSKYFFGDDPGRLGEYAWFAGNSGNTTHPVGQKKPNAWGLCDVHGNVWEWCEDWFGDGYYANSPSADPTGSTSGSCRVHRGGGWCNSAWICRSAFRNGHLPGSRDYGLGFRAVLSPVQ